MTHNYLFNIDTKDYSELLIMPTDGRWDLTRRLKVQCNWRVQSWFPNITFIDYFTALLRFVSFSFGTGLLHVIFMVLSFEEDYKDKGFLSSLVIGLCLLSLVAEEIKVESFLISPNSAYISDGFSTEIL